jgi:hypothetical protein
MSFSNPYVIGSLVLAGLAILAYWWFFVTSGEEEPEFTSPHSSDGKPIGGGPSKPPEPEPADSTPDRTDPDPPTHEPVDDDVGSIGNIRLKLPRQMPHRSRFERDGVTTLKELRNLDSLEEPYGIGPSRASDIYRWFKESNLHSDLPEHLTPEREKENPSFATEEVPAEETPTESFPPGEELAEEESDVVNEPKGTSA